MPKIWLTLIVSAFPLCLLAETASLSGNWKTVLGKLDDGTEDTIYFQLRQNGAALAGRAIYPWGILQVQNGAVEGNRFHFTLQQGEDAQFKVEGELSGNELNYRSTSWDGKWQNHTASRAPEDEGSPPQRIEPPPIHPVPYNGLAKTPPMGWNSWNKFQHLVSDKVVRDMAGVIVGTGMRDAGYVAGGAPQIASDLRAPFPDLASAILAEAVYDRTTGFCQRIAHPLKYGLQILVSVNLRGTASVVFQIIDAHSAQVFASSSSCP